MKLDGNIDIEILSILIKIIYVNKNIVYIK